MAMVVDNRGVAGTAVSSASMSDRVQGGTAGGGGGSGNASDSLDRRGSTLASRIARFRSSPALPREEREKNFGGEMPKHFWWQKRGEQAVPMTTRVNDNTTVASSTSPPPQKSASASKFGYVPSRTYSPEAYSPSPQKSNGAAPGHAVAETSHADAVMASPTYHSRRALKGKQKLHEDVGARSVSAVLGNRNCGASTSGAPNSEASSSSTSLMPGAGIRSGVVRSIPFGATTADTNSSSPQLAHASPTNGIARTDDGVGSHRQSQMRRGAHSVSRSLARAKVALRKQRESASGTKDEESPGVQQTTRRSSTLAEARRRLKLSSTTSVKAPSSPSSKATRVTRASAAGEESSTVVGRASADTRVPILMAAKAKVSGTGRSGIRPRPSSSPAKASLSAEMPRHGQFTESMEDDGAEDDVDSDAEVLAAAFEKTSATSDRQPPSAEAMARLAVVHPKLHAALVSLQKNEERQKQRTSRKRRQKPEHFMSPSATQASKKHQLEASRDEEVFSGQIHDNEESTVTHRGDDAPRHCVIGAEDDQADEKDATTRGDEDDGLLMRSLSFSPTLPAKDMNTEKPAVSNPEDAHRGDTTSPEGPRDADTSSVVNAAATQDGSQSSSAPFIFQALSSAEKDAARAHTAAAMTTDAAGLLPDRGDEAGSADANERLQVQAEDDDDEESIITLSDVLEGDAYTGRESDEQSVGKDEEDDDEEEFFDAMNADSDDSGGDVDVIVESSGKDASSPADADRLDRRRVDIENDDDEIEARTSVSTAPPSAPPETVSPPLVDIDDPTGSVRNDCDTTPALESDHSSANRGTSFANDDPTESSHEVSNTKEDDNDDKQQDPSLATGLTASLDEVVHDSKAVSFAAPDVVDIEPIPDQHESSTPPTPDALVESLGEASVDGKRGDEVVSLTVSVDGDACLVGLIPTDSVTRPMTVPDEHQDEVSSSGSDGECGDESPLHDIVSKVQYRMKRLRAMRTFGVWKDAWKYRTSTGPEPGTGGAAASMEGEESSIRDGEGADDVNGHCNSADASGEGVIITTDENADVTAPTEEEEEEDQDIDERRLLPHKQELAIDTDAESGLCSPGSVTPDADESLLPTPVRHDLAALEDELQHVTLEDSMSHAELEVEHHIGETDMTATKVARARGRSIVLESLPMGLLAAVVTSHETADIGDMATDDVQDVGDTQISEDEGTKAEEQDVGNSEDMEDEVVADSIDDADDGAVNEQEEDVHASSEPEVTDDPEPALGPQHVRAPPPSSSVEAMSMSTQILSETFAKILRQDVTKNLSDGVESIATSMFGQLNAMSSEISKMRALVESERSNLNGLMLERERVEELSRRSLDAAMMNQQRLERTLLETARLETEAMTRTSHATEQLQLTLGAFSDSLVEETKVLQSRRVDAIEGPSRAEMQSQFNTDDGVDSIEDAAGCVEKIDDDIPVDVVDEKSQAQDVGASADTEFPLREGESDGGAETATIDDAGCDTRADGTEAMPLESAATGTGDDAGATSVDEPALVNMLARKLGSAIREELRHLHSDRDEVTTATIGSVDNADGDHGDASKSTVLREEGVNFGYDDRYDEVRGLAGVAHIASTISSELDVAIDRVKHAVKRDRPMQTTDCAFANNGALDLDNHMYFARQPPPPPPSQQQQQEVIEVRAPPASIMRSVVGVDAYVEPWPTSNSGLLAIWDGKELRLRSRPRTDGSSQLNVAQLHDQMRKLQETLEKSMSYRLPHQEL